MMKLFRTTALIALTLGSAWAADRAIVHRVHLAGPMGNDNGHLILAGDQLVFVDDSKPDMSFTIGRNDIRALTFNGGVLTIDLSRPFVGAWDQRSDAFLQFADPNEANTVAAWSGVALTGIPAAPGATSGLGIVGVASDQLQFDVKHDDDYGRLIVSDRGLAWENLSNASKSRTWIYNEIKEFRRDKGDRALRVRTYGGQSYEFKLRGGPEMADTVYNLVADRIIAARRP